MATNPYKSSSTASKDGRNDYAIVLFINEGNAPGIILSTWIFDEGQQCYYPTVKTNEARDNLLKKKSEPQENDWSTNAIKILNFYETFAEARAHLKKAEETSNLSSDYEEEERQGLRRHLLRKRIARKRFFPINEEESDDDDEVEQEEPKLKCSQVKMHPYPLLVNPKDFTPSQPVFSKSSCRQATSTASQFSSQENQTTFRRESVTPTNATPSQHLFSESSCRQATPTTAQFSSQENQTTFRRAVDLSAERINQQNTFNLELREMLANMFTILQRVEAKVDALQGGRLAEPIDEEEQAILASLPAKNIEEFESVEKALQENTSFKQKFAKRIASVGGRSCRGLINNMLKSLLTDSVAETFSLTGKAGNNLEKKAFISTGVFKIMSFACKKIYNEETDANVRVAVSDWLNQAKVRKTRREKNALQE